MEAARPLRLWEIAGELDAIGEIIAENGGEITPFLESELDKIEGAFEEKVERVALYIRECKANAEAAAVEEKRLAAIRRAFENKASGLSNYLQAQLERIGKAKVQTPKVRVRVQQNGRPSIRWAGGEIPEDYRVVNVTVDGNKAYEDWKAERLPDGFVVEVGRHIRIQ